ncbi:hypothetical protein E2C01_046337 [Portunus trituberculatus]|uniref:Uncharacterized protein n=1 Tax=Portunus trituberculatus TaxID=210409 RepID=A0A5B7G4L6_PORTR|nr:hypothetical protein [Portunus trituberculatus]
MGVPSVPISSALGVSIYTRWCRTTPETTQHFCSTVHTSTLTALHCTRITRSLKEAPPRGDKVLFNVHKGDKGPEA